MGREKHIAVSVTVHLKIPNGRQEGLERVYTALARENGSLSAPAAAREMGVNASEFHRKFKEAAGITYRQARLRVKLELARALLIETDAPIVEIAEVAGYSERSNFDHAFTRVMGESPAIVRRGRSRRKVS